MGSIPEAYKPHLRTLSCRNCLPYFGYLGRHPDALKFRIHLGTDFGD
jgi:hypothetical protein